MANTLLGDSERNTSVVYWRTGYGTNLDKGDNIDEIIQSLVNETARQFAEEELIGAVKELS